MTILKVLLFIFGYLVCGVLYCLLLVYLETHEITDKYGMFSVMESEEAFCNAAAWPISVLGLGIWYLSCKFKKLHNKIYDKMQAAYYEKKSRGKK